MSGRLGAFSMLSVVPLTANAKPLGRLGENMNIGDKISMPYDGQSLPGVIRGFRGTRYNGRQAIVDVTYPDGAVLRRRLYVKWLEKWSAQQTLAVDASQAGSQTDDGSGSRH